MHHIVVKEKFTILPLTIGALSDQIGPWQFEHAAPGWIFQLWTWTYLVTMVIGLMNLLLALLLEALCSAQNENRRAPGVISEVCEVVTELASRLKVAVIPSSRPWYMSDTGLRELLLRRQHSTLHEQDLRSVVKNALSYHSMTSSI
jgi:hypothetical protein